jgi:hypothetical protein
MPGAECNVARELADQAHHEHGREAPGHLSGSRQPRLIDEIQHDRHGEREAAEQSADQQRHIEIVAAE